MRTRNTHQAARRDFYSRPTVTFYDIAEWVIPQLLQHGRVRRGYVGIAGATVALDRRVTLFHHLEQNTGVRVQSIETGSPAAVGGVLEGDIVIGIDGVTIDSVDRLHQTLDAGRIHRECALKVLRDVKSPRLVYLVVRPTERQQ